MSVRGRATAPAVAVEAEPQTLLQLLHGKTLSSEGVASVSALWRLGALFSSHCSSLFRSAVFIADLVVCRQPLPVLQSLLARCLPP